MASRIPFRPVKLGVAPTRRVIFSREEAGRCKRLIEARLRAWGVSFVNIDFLNEEGLLYQASDVPRIVERWRAEGVDAVFAPHVNFGTEDAVALLGKTMGLPFLLWGPRDDAPLADGTRLRDTQCGLFATSKVLRRMGVPFTYVVNSWVDAPVFERGARNFLAAAAVAREFRKARIGQVSTRPQAFWTTMCNEGELLERFGIQVVNATLVDLAGWVDRCLRSRAADIAEETRQVRQRADCSALTQDELARVAALKLALVEWAERDNLSGIALQCWSALQDCLHMASCFAHGEVTGLGVPVACETDVHGAITSIMLQAAALGATPTFFADLTIRHPEHENRELLWHCGPFPLDLKADGEPARLSPHYMMPDRAPAVGEWRLRDGDLTLARFDGDHGDYRLFLGHARGAEGPYNRGTYLWIEVADWPRWEEALVRGPYIHHIVGVHGRFAPALYEACRYIPGLTPECVEPTEEQIAAHLRGADLP